MRSLAAIAFAIVIEASAGAAAAQQSVEYASVGGRVVDPSGAVVSDAQVVARQIDTNFAAHAATDQGGRFRFPYLKVGAYEITVQQSGFADAVRRLSLTAGGAVDLQIALMLSAVTANVTVSAEAAVLDTARTQIAGTMPQDEIRNVPLNGRNFLDLARAIPGGSPANAGMTQ